MPDAAQPATGPDGDEITSGCGGVSYAARGTNLELLVLFDNSSSMVLPALSWECLTLDQQCTQSQASSLWDVAVNELMSFVDHPGAKGVSVALEYFGSECAPDAYLTPSVPPGLLPEHAQAVRTSLTQTLPLSETATRPALEGALAYLRERARAPAYNARPVVLLVTDGVPDEADCDDNSTASVSRVAAEGLQGQPSVPTYVFVTAPGVALDEVARAGGTEKAVLADLSQVGTLTEALLGVVNQEVAELSCEYDLPAEYFTQVDDPSLVNLTRNDAPVGMVAGPGGCGPMGGWYYDDPQTPARILTCPATCADLKAGGTVDILLECPTIQLF